MKSGMLAAEATYEEVFKDGKEGEFGTEVATYREKFEASWLYKELYRYTNFCLTPFLTHPQLQSQTKMLFSAKKKTKAKRTIWGVPAVPH